MNMLLLLLAFLKLISCHQQRNYKAKSFSHLSSKHQHTCALVKKLFLLHIYQPIIEKGTNNGKLDLDWHFLKKRMKMLQRINH